MDRTSNINDFVVTYLTCWADAMKNLGDAEARKKLYRSGIYNGEKDCKGWTDFHLKEILYPLAEKTGYKSKACKDCEYDCKVIGNREKSCEYNRLWSKEFYRLDIAFYNYRGQPYHWGLDYAVEHENTEFRMKEEDGKVTVHRGGWLNEFLKLLPLNCSKARVIIGYDNFDEDEWEMKQEYLLGVLCDRAVKETLVEKPIILILGPDCEYLDKTKEEEDLCFRVKLITKVQNGWVFGDVAGPKDSGCLLEGNDKYKAVRDDLCKIFAKIRNK